MFGKKEEEDDIEYRVYAYATLDLQEKLKENPFLLNDPGKVKWEVQNDGDKYIAMGTIKVPVTMFFSEDPENKDSLNIDRVVMKGQRVYDANGEEPEMSEGYDPDHGVNFVHVSADARQFIMSNIR